MGQVRKLKLEINRKRFFRGCDGAECFPGPKTSTAKHGKDHLRFRPVADSKPVRREVVMSNVIKKVRIICAVHAMEMEAEHVRFLRSQSFDLSLVRIAHQRQMIEFRKVNVAEFGAGLEKFGPGLENSRIALKFALMIGCSQTGIIDENFLLVRDGIEFLFGSPIGKKN